MAVGVSFLDSLPNSWGSVSMRDVFGASERLTGVASIVFAGCMLTGHVVGDHVLEAIGETRLLVGALCLSLLGGAVMTSTSTMAVGLVGFALWGLGISVVFPQLYALAARMPGMAAGVGLAAMAIGQRIGFMSEPALTGRLSEHMDLRAAITVMLVGAAVLLLTSGSRSAASAGLPRRHPSPDRATQCIECRLRRRVSAFAARGHGHSTATTALVQTRGQNPLSALMPSSTLWSSCSERPLKDTSETRGTSAIMRAASMPRSPSAPSEPMSSATSCSMSAANDGLRIASPMLEASVSLRGGSFPAIATATDTRNVAAGSSDLDQVLPRLHHPALVDHGPVGELGRGDRDGDRRARAGLERDIGEALQLTRHPHDGTRRLAT